MQQLDIRNFDCTTEYSVYRRQLKKDQISEVICVAAIAFLFGMWLFAAVLIHL